MLSSKIFVLFLLLPWIGNFGGHHYGLTKAKETQNISTPAIKTSLTERIISSTNTLGLSEDVASETGTTNFGTAATYSIVDASIVQVNIVEITASRQIVTAQQSSRLQAKAISPTPQVRSFASYVASSIAVSSETRIYFSVQPSRVISANLNNTFQANSTASHVSENSINDGCATGQNGQNECDTYVTKWVDFYLNIGGWIMLAIVLLGIIILVATHIQGKQRRKEIKGLPALMYREMTRNRGHWV